MREFIPIPPHFVPLLRSALEEAEDAETQEGIVRPAVFELLDALQHGDHPSALARAMLVAIYQQSEAQQHAGVQGVVRGLIHDGGANPLDWEGDFFKLTQGVWFTSTRCVVDMEHAGRGLRTPSGGNMLHALAWNNSRALLELLTEAAEKNDLSHPDWKQQVREDGGTVLHALWEAADRRGNFTPALLWQNTAALAGTGMDAQVDHLGRSGLDAMAEVLARHAELLEATAEDTLAIKTLKARAQARILDQATDTPTLQRSSLRL